MQDVPRLARAISVPRTALLLVVEVAHLYTAFGREVGRCARAGPDYSHTPLRTDLCC